MDDDARRLELSPSLRQLCHPDLDPLFWVPERLGALSGWWGHVPFAGWVMRAMRPRILVELGTQMLDIYAGEVSRVALRLGLEAAVIPGVAEHYAQMRHAQVLAARAIVRRGIDRGEIAADTSVTLLLDTLIGGAMMHAMVTPDDRRADLARSTGAYAAQLVSFLLRAVTPA